VWRFVRFVWHIEAAGAVFAPIDGVYVASCAGLLKRRDIASVFDVYAEKCGA
jgi:hypothetical protein